MRYGKAFQRGEREPGTQAQAAAFGARHDEGHLGEFTDWGAAAYLTWATPMFEIEATAKQALEHHRRGELLQAERLYREVLQSQPQHAEANYNLGILLVRDGRLQAGLPHLKTALHANPAEGRYCLSYVEVLLASGNAGEASTVIEEGRRRGLQGAGAGPMPCCSE